MSKRWIVLAPLAILALVAFIAIGGAVVMVLWNWLLPPLFGWPQLTYWQALGILALCRILFGGCGLRGSAHSRVRGRIGDRIAGRVAERMEHMTPEERERFRQRIHERFGFGPPTGGHQEP
jgi:hypothetical protein